MIIIKRHNKEKTMEIKSTFLGIIIGIVLTFSTLYLIGLGNQNSEDNDPTIHIEKGKSYENKKEASFKVFQVLSDAALMREVSDKVRELYFGKTVLIRGEDFYNDQVVTVKNPRIVGIYRYTTVKYLDMNVPIIEGEME